MTPAESHYVLQTLLAQRKVRQSQIAAVLGGRGNKIKNIRERLADLEGIQGASGKRGRPRQASARPARRRNVKISPKVRALRRLQGKYMGYVRRLKPAEKARVREVREKQGMQAAIRLASSLSTKSS